MPQTSFRDSQNPWFANQQAGASPAPGGGGALPPNAWQGLGPGISNVRGGGDLSKWLNPKDYQNWTRDQWRAAITQAPYEYGGNGILQQLEQLIGTHALNQHKNYFASGGQGYLPGHFDYNTGKMVYNGIDPKLVEEVNNRNFAFSHGSTSGAPVDPTNASLGTHMMSTTNAPTNVPNRSQPLPSNPLTNQPNPVGGMSSGGLPPNPVAPTNTPGIYDRTRTPTTTAPGVMQNQNSTKGFNASWSQNNNPWSTSSSGGGSNNPWKRWRMQ